MNRRKNRRRRQHIHDGRVSLNDRITISASACKALLSNGGIDGIDRLMILCAVASGDTTLSLAELRAEVCRKVIKAGVVQAAIRARNADV
jgi:hypothetical protein